MRQDRRISHLSRELGGPPTELHALVHSVGDHVQLGQVAQRERQQPPVIRRLQDRDRLVGGAFGGRPVAVPPVDTRQPTQRGAEGAFQVLKDRPRPLGRVLAAGLKRAGAPVLEREKAVEDAGLREVRKLSANLRPLVVIAMIAPLLGLLGTVYGIIQAFSEVAFHGGQGKPEQLAAGLSQALITTAAGLTIAVPTQAAYYWLRAKIDRFVRRAEDSYDELLTAFERKQGEAGGVA